MWGGRVERCATDVMCEEDVHASLTGALTEPDTYVPESYNRLLSPVSLSLFLAPKPISMCIQCYITGGHKGWVELYRMFTMS